MALRDSLADRFPLVGDFHAFRGRPVGKPRDADWLPRNWESRRYPKGKRGADNTEAILQWVDLQTEQYRKLMPLTDPEHADLYPNPEERDWGAVVRDAYRLVEQLREEKGWPAPPKEPDRGYRHFRADLEAVVAELNKVRDWVARCGEPEPIPDTPKEKRDKWIYDECMKGTPYQTIAIGLTKKPKSWSRIESVNGIKSAARRYAERHSLPKPPARQSGRRRR